MYTVSTGATINANDLNQVINVLQAPSGAQENGTYFLTGTGTSGITGLGAWVPSLSRTSTPASVSINTSIQAPVNCNSPSTNNLSSNGFHVATAYSTASNVAANVAGNFTIQY